MGFGAGWWALFLYDCLEVSHTEAIWQGYNFCSVSYCHTIVLFANCQPGWLWATLQVVAQIKRKEKWIERRRKKRKKKGREYCNVNRFASKTFRWFRNTNGFSPVYRVHLFFAQRSKLRRRNKVFCSYLYILSDRATLGVTLGRFGSQFET